jgi:phage terminase large subunit-like protein
MNPRITAHNQYKALLTAAKREERVREVTRRLAQGDLFFLLVNILNRADIDRDWLFARCREVQADPDGFLDLWAREHYKSTIITYALSIQDILNDPEVTIGIHSHTRPIAKGFLRQIKYELETNTKLKELFPDILWENPRKEAPKWNEDDGIVLKRKSNPKEATVEATGLVDGQPTSKHYKKQIYDDVVTRESVTNPDMIAKVTAAWELSLNLGADGGVQRYIGTRYHFNDTYRTIMDRGAAKPRIYPATDNGKPEGEPVLLSREALAKKYKAMGVYTFGCQMLQNPRADSVMGFKEQWLNYWDPIKTGWAGMNIYILVDPASSKKELADYTSMWVVGLAADQNKYIIDGVRDRLNLTERAGILMKLHRTYRPINVGYERYGMQADIEHIKTVQSRQNYHFTITELGGSMPKEDRIRRLVPDFEQGRVYLPVRLMYTDTGGKPHDLTAEFINEEYLAFPVGLHDDMLDGLARIKDRDLCAVHPRPQESMRPGAGPERAITDYDPFGGVAAGGY